METSLKRKFTKSQLIKLVTDVVKNLKPTLKGINIEKNQLLKLEKNIDSLYCIAFPIVNRTSLNTETDYSEARAVLHYSAISFLEARILVTITSLYLDKPLLHSISLTKKQIENMRNYRENLNNFYKILKFS